VALSTLRHSFATPFTDGRGNACELELATGHSGIKTTERYVRAASVQDIAAALDRMDSVGKQSSVESGVSASPRHSQGFGGSPMTDSFRTVLANVLVSRFTRPRLLMVQDWFWLAAEAADTEEKRRCLDATLELEPENEPASTALLVLDRRRLTS
jgi:hypothetical protein